MISSRLFLLLSIIKQQQRCSSVDINQLYIRDWALELSYYIRSIICMSWPLFPNELLFIPQATSFCSRLSHLLILQ